MVRRALHERLERLERKIPRPADQTEREGWTELAIRHFRVWAVGGGIEEIPEEIRDAKMWAYAEEYGPVFLGLVWEGILEGRQEFLAAGIDFTLAGTAPTSWAADSILPRRMLLKRQPSVRMYVPLPAGSERCYL